MATERPISQLDLLLLGRRGLPSRVNGVERSVRELTLSGAGDGITGSPEVRPNLLINGSFEYYDRGATLPNDWQTTGTAALATAVAGTEGNVAVLCAPGATLAQTVASGVAQPASSAVLSVSARAASASATVTLAIAHTPGVALGPVYRIDPYGNELMTAELPGDGAWYRFWRPAVLVGGDIATVQVGNSGASAASAHLDAVKYEAVAGSTSYQEPTAYVGGDWGASIMLRNLIADNIVAGTLTVGGSLSTNPRISVRDDADQEIAVIGDPTGGFYGIHLKQGAGLLVSDTGSISVTDSGHVEVAGGGGITIGDGGGLLVDDGGDITVAGGGNVIIDDDGKLIVGDPGGARTEVRDYGVVGYDEDGEVIFGLNELGAVGSLDIENGDVLIGNGGASYAFWDNSEGKLKIKGDITASTITGSTITGGKTVLSNNGIDIFPTAISDWTSDASIDFFDAAGSSVVSRLYTTTHVGDQSFRLVSDYNILLDSGAGGGRLTLDSGGGPAYLRAYAGAELSVGTQMSGSNHLRVYTNAMTYDFGTYYRNYLAFGKHPDYDETYQGIWQGGVLGSYEPDYAVLIGAAHLYLNSRSGTIYFRDNNTDRGRITGDGMRLEGNLAVGGRNPSTAIRIVASPQTDTADRYSLVLQNANASANRLLVRGDNYFWISGTWVQASDRGLKKGLRELTSERSRLRAARPTAYRYTADADDAPERYGFVAQELQEVYPELVSRTLQPDGTELLGIDYTGLIAPLWAEVQALDKEKEQLQARLEELERRLPRR